MGINQPATKLCTSGTADTTVLLPVAQLKDSHDLQIDLELVGDKTVVAPPYLAMSVGDKVPLKVERFWDDDWEDDPYIRPKTLTEADIGQPLRWTVSGNELDNLEGGYVKLSYSVNYDPATVTTQSEKQQLDVLETSESLGPLLPPPAIKDYDSDMLDPEAFPQGVPMVIPLYPGIQAGDDVMLYAVGGDTPLIITVRVDQSTIDSGKLYITLNYEWLSANNGSQVSVMYQYARVGSAGTSAPLLFTLREPLYLPHPIIEGVIREGEDEEFKGYLLGSTLTRGFYIDIPEEAVIGDNDKRQMIFDGFGSTGKYTADPTVGNPRRFQIPKHVVPANLGKRVYVFYQVTPSGEPAYPSKRFNLGIKDISQGWPIIQITEPDGASNTSVSLAKVTDVVTLELRSWMYMDEGQRVRVIANGVLQAGGQESIDLRAGDAELVTEEEYQVGELIISLPRAYLAKLKINEQFYVTVAISFDDGHSYKTLPQISPQLIA